MAMMQCGRRSSSRRRRGRTRARQSAAAPGMGGDDEVVSDGEGNIPEVLLVLVGPPLVVAGELDLVRSI